MAELSRIPVDAVAVCDGGGCRELLATDDARHPRHAVRRLAVVAATLRERGVLGVLGVREAATGRVVATRRVWP